VEIGELVAAAPPGMKDDKKCPFSHEKPNPKEKNELGGIGTKLGENAAKGVGIRHESRKDADPKASFFGSSKEKDPDPRDRKGKQKLNCVTIKVSGKVIEMKSGKGAAKPLRYPLTCAAHHLVPAQESLKGHAILKYMCKDGEDQDFRNSKSAAPAPVASMVWGNVAYNVNGCHNSAWLPGNYAVGGGTGGAAIWKDRANAARDDDLGNENWAKSVDTSSSEWDRGDDDREEEVSAPLLKWLRSAKRTSFMLAGKHLYINDGNPKWAYVKAAMDATNAQFHDRHEDYSKQVKKYLTKIAERYGHMKANVFDDCPDCKKARLPANAKASLVGPPYEIVARLKICSDFYKQLVSGYKKKATLGKNVYTSGWVGAWVKSSGK
jgi:hypothetical protein